MTHKTFSLMALAVFMLLGVGCQCPITRLNLSVELDKSFQDKYPNRDVEVDLVAVGPNEQVRWEGTSMTAYWESGDTMRRSLPTKTLKFNSSKLDAQVVTADDPMWAQWLQGANDKAPPRMYILVQFPKTFDRTKDDKPGNADVRRQILPTGSCRWNKGMFDPPPTVKLLVNADRLITLTAVKPDNQ